MNEKNYSKIYWVRNLLIFALCLASVPLLAQEKEIDSYGLYYDAKSGNYFSNGRSAFLIQPTGPAQYLERIEYSLNEEPFKPYDGKLKLEKEGPYKVRFRAVDPVLNWSPVQSFRLFVDRTPPKMQIEWSGPQYRDGDRFFVSPKSSMRLSSEDSLAGVSHDVFRHNGEVVRFHGQKSFAKPGAYHVEFASVDHVGNQSPWKEHKFFVDDQAPVSTYQLDGKSFQWEQKTYVNLGAHLVLQSQDADSGVEAVEYQMDNGPVLTYQEPIALSGTKIEIRYRGMDRVGNAEAWKSVVFHQDTQAPKIHIGKAGRYEVIGGTIYAQPGLKLSASFEDHESGMGEIFISKKDHKFTGSREKEFVFSEPGEYLFEVKAMDRVGNASESSPMVVMIDGSAPVSKVEGTEPMVARDEMYLSGIPNQLKITSQDAGVGVGMIEYSYDGKKFMPLSGGIDMATWKEPKQTVYYRAVDKVGNAEPVQSITVQVLTQGPMVGLFVEGDEAKPNLPLSAVIKKNEQMKMQADQKQPGKKQRGVASP